MEKLERKELLKLMKAAAQTSYGQCYNYKGEELDSDALNEVLREQLKPLTGDYNMYRRNYLDLFELIEETMDEILPKKVAESYSQFAEVKTYAQQERPIFKVPSLGKMRAKQFITRVGLAGLYETFKLGETWFEVKTSAIGGAAHVGFEEFLDGRVNFAELTQIVLDSMDELIYKEVVKSLISSINQLPAANQAAFNGFDEQLMDRLITVVSAYGTPTIYCTREFAVNMVPAGDWVSDAMRDAKWNTGYFTTYKGIRVVILPQSFEDSTNARKIVDPGYAWVIPSDGRTKPVKVAFEGTMHMKDLENYDWSHEIHYYQKVGVGTIMTNNIAVYTDTTLKGKLNTIE